MSSEEEVVKMQKVLAASVILIALSVGLGGFETFETWYQLDIEDRSEDSDGDSYDSDVVWKFTLDSISYDTESTEIYSGETYDYSDSGDIDYGENEVFEESENPIKNIQRGGYLALGLILFLIWKLQEIKTESSEEVRTEILDQIDKIMKGTGSLIIIIIFYFIFGGFMEEDFEDIFVGNTDSDGDYRNWFGIDCEEAWDDKPEFEWIGSSKLKYDDSVCPGTTYWYDGSGEIENSLKLGFFAFLGSLGPLYFVFNSINQNMNFASFSVPSVPNIPNQNQEMKPYSPFKENKVEDYGANQNTVYTQPEVSTIAIPEDEDD